MAVRHPPWTSGGGKYSAETGRIKAKTTHPQNPMDFDGDISGSGTRRGSRVNPQALPEIGGWRKTGPQSGKRPPAGSCWEMQWNEPKPQINSVESMPMTSRPGKSGFNTAKAFASLACR